MGISNEIVVILQALIKSNNDTAQRFNELNDILEGICVKIDTLQQQVNHLNKELGI